MYISKMSREQKKERFDFESFKEQAMADIYQGKKMGGPDGVFGPF